MSDESIISEIMSKRHNTQFFSDKVPDKSLVEKILKDAHTLTPHKNNFYRYKVNVWGPEHKEQKRLIGIYSVCTKTFYQKNPTEENFKKLENIFDRWISKENALKGYPPVDGCLFNSQVLAPYLLVYTHNPFYKTKSQIENVSSCWHKLFDNRISDPEDLDWIIQASMHGITTSYLCAEKNLRASFCRCFFSDDNLTKIVNKPRDSSILLNSSSVKKEITFLLGIGYSDENLTIDRYLSPMIKPKFDEIVEWK